MPKLFPVQHVVRGIRDAFGNTSYARGYEIQSTPGAVVLQGIVQTEEFNWALSGTVQGTAEEPYEVDVEIDLDPAGSQFEVAFSECSCPVTDFCKHGVALVLAWVSEGTIDQTMIVALPNERGATTEQPRPAGNASTVASVASTPPTVGRTQTRTLALAPQLQEWLLTTAAEAEARDGTPLKKATSSKAMQTCVVYVITEAGQFWIQKGKRRPDGSDAELAGDASNSWVSEMREPPAYAQEGDQSVVAQMRALWGYDRYGPYEPSVTLAGTLAYHLLTLALATGRAFIAADQQLRVSRAKAGASGARALRAPLPSKLAASRVAVLEWREVPLTTLASGASAKKMGYRLSARVGDAPVLLLPTDPLVALDVANNAIFPVDTAVPPTLIKHALALPPISVDDAGAWAYVQDALQAFPGATALPPFPVPVVALTAPNAILRFFVAEVPITRGWGARTQVDQLVFPAVQLVFDYTGRRVPLRSRATDFGRAIEVDSIDGKTTATRLRNVREESRWIRRVPSMLLPATRVEEAMLYSTEKPGDELLACLALPTHDWAADGAGVLAEAQMAGFVLEFEPDFPLTVEEIPEVELDLSPTAETGWFRISLGVAVGNERVDIAPALAKLIGAQKDAELWLDALPTVDTVLLSVASADRAKRAVVVRISGERVHAILAPVFDWFRGGGVSPISGLQAALLHDLPPATVKYLGRENPRWVSMREAIVAGIALAPTAPHRGFEATLRPYQRDGLAWLVHLRAISMSGVLADDMGLGKTVQTLAFLHLRRQTESAHRKPCLIVAPTSVTVNWLAEARRFASTLTLLSHHGSARSLDGKRAANADIVLTSYPILQRDAKILGAIEWDVVVFDEAQMIKNPKAKTYQAAQVLPAEMRMALTGTPMENHLGELWALFNLLLPGLLGDLESFNRIFRHPIEQHANTTQLNKLRSRIRPFLLRRTREQVLGDLPEKTEYTRWIELESEQADLYESLRTAIHDDIRKVIDKKGLKQSTIHILDALLKLRQVCCDPRLVRLPSAKERFANARSAKLEWLLEHLPILVEEGRQVLVFSQFTSMLALIAEALTAQGMAFETLTGDTIDRDTPIKRFQAGEVRVFLLSLKAGGVGLNLTAADTVIHYDPWWNPAVEAQATARAHRIGQLKPVFVTKLVSKGTLEERMMALLDRKRELAAALLNGDVGALVGITLEDVESLLAPISALEEKVA